MMGKVWAKIAMIVVGVLSNIKGVRFIRWSRKKTPDENSEEINHYEMNWDDKEITNVRPPRLTDNDSNEKG